jgi:hypothetical protein
LLATIGVALRRHESDGEREDRHEGKDFFHAKKRKVDFRKYTAS